jgi:hypothetical protein
MFDPTVIFSFDRRMDDFKQEFLAEFKHRVEERTPVRTGAAKAGYYWDAEGPEATLFNKMYYVEYLEYGTIYMYPRAMVQTTMLEIDDIMKVASVRAGL